jgi:hypothetical protein
MKEREDQIVEALASPAVHSADQLVGAPVIDAAGDEVGRLRHIMIEASSGAIVYGVVALTGSLVQDGKLRPLPWRLLGPRDGARRLRLAVEPELLRYAPAFAPDQWPDLSDSRWGLRAHVHFGLAP